jgi:hypothetical protein
VGLIGKLLYSEAGSTWAASNVSGSKYRPSQAKQENPGEGVPGFDSVWDVKLLMLSGPIEEAQRNSAIFSYFLKLELADVTG